MTAEKDGDVAYVGSDWNEGISPWEFGTGVNLRESVPLLRGSVFTDRGVYRLGEEVHLKAVLRENAPDGIRLLPNDARLRHHPRRQNRVVDERTVRVNDWSSAEWTMTLPPDGTLGNYSLRAILESDRPKRDSPAAAARREPRRRARLGGLGEVSPRLLPRRGVSASRLPRRCHARRRQRRGRPAQGRRDRTLPVRRADGRAPGELEVHQVTAVMARRPRSLNGSATTAGSSSAGTSRWTRSAAETWRHPQRRGKPDGARPAGAAARDEARRRHPVRLPARRRRRGRLAPAHRQPRQHHRPSGALVHRRAASSRTSSSRPPASRPRSSPPGSTASRSPACRSKSR